MADGTLRPIEKVQEGDRVLSRDEKSGETTAKPVLTAFRHETNSTLSLFFENGEEIETTEEHPFYVANHGFVRAEDLRVGNAIATHDGPPAVLNPFSTTPQTILSSITSKSNTFSPTSLANNTSGCITSGL